MFVSTQERRGFKFATLVVDIWIKRRDFLDCSCMHVYNKPGTLSLADRNFKTLSHSIPVLQTISKNTLDLKNSLLLRMKLILVCARKAFFIHEKSTWTLLVEPLAFSVWLEPDTPQYNLLNSNIVSMLRFTYLSGVTLIGEATVDFEYGCCFKRLIRITSGRFNTWKLELDVWNKHPAEICRCCWE